MWIEVVDDFLFFFFKQKTAYDMLRSLVGSEMCIRDSLPYFWTSGGSALDEICGLANSDLGRFAVEADGTCLLYTSDAADDLLCVDLGGRRIIKKKNTKTKDYPIQLT